MCAIDRSRLFYASEGSSEPVVPQPWEHLSASAIADRSEYSRELCDRDDHPDQHEHDDRDLRPDPEWRHGETAYLDRLRECLRAHGRSRLSCRDDGTPQNLPMEPPRIRARAPSQGLPHAGAMSVRVRMACPG